MSVISTIRPLAFIAQAILGADGQAQSIMDAQDSPHHFTLTPSDRLRVADSDLVIWIGPALEVELADFMAGLEADRPVLRVLQLDDLQIRELESGETDPHFWLSPDNADVIAQALAQQLSASYPQQASVFADNLQRFQSALDDANTGIAAALRQISSPNYVVYHDAYQYFEAHYGLSHALALVDNPEVEPGMRAILAKRAQLDSLQPTCLLLEPDARQALVDTLLRERRSLQVVTIDPLGYDITISAGAYIALLESVATAFTDCLSPAISN